MRATQPGVVASACLGLAVLAEVGAVVLPWGLRSPYDTIFFAVYNLTVTAVGALIVSRMPGHPVGWILCLFGLQGAVTSELAIGWGLRAVDEGWSGGEVAQWVGLVSWCPGALMWVLALLYSPTGRLPDRRWRIAVWAAVAGTSAYVVGWSFSPSSVNALTGELNRFAVDWLPGQQLTVVGGVLLSLSAAGAAVSLVVRFRHADRTVRQQLKWVGFAGVLLALMLPVSIVLWSVSPIVRVVSPLVLSAMVIGLGAAVLRYRLFDVDLIILRSVAYACVSVFVLTVYAGVSVSLGIVVGRSSAWQVAAATLAAAALFRPALRAVRLVLDRRFDRDGHSARLRVDSFLEGLRSGTEQPDRIQDVLREALRDPQLRLLLFLPASGGFADLRGRAAELDPGLAVVRLERAGVPEAVVQYLDTGDPARPSRVRHLVEHGRLALQVARLGVELNRQLDELDRSRARIAGAADEERRRIQRDLHDGAQQWLVTVGLGLRGIEGRLRTTGAHEDADRVDGLVADLAATIEELRRLAHRLPPPQLDLGIAAAFRELAGRSPIPVIVDADPERLDRSTETTAYFVGCEGLTNVIKHARATAVTMRVVRQNGSLVVSVADDGVGGARAREGSGLAGLADRVAAVGGRLHVESGTQGTLLTAELPCG
ncbi:sensor histidine kinase [Pedococcus bigeumensis]|uniref:sensor histidine kinase n=1 Tax=Pedococcus bigeumensis TaxID=433644 RepID=UPI001386E83F|nr:histidine kinase [Pedococcus bigeumensis]